MWERLKARGRELSSLWADRDFRKGVAVGSIVTIVITVLVIVAL